MQPPSSFEYLHFLSACSQSTVCYRSVLIPAALWGGPLVDLITKWCFRATIKSHLQSESHARPGEVGETRNTPVHWPFTDGKCSTKQHLQPPHPCLESRVNGLGCSSRLKWQGATEIHTEHKSPSKAGFE